MRRSDGRETRHRLVEWDKGQASSERLAVTLLRSDGYQNIDPSHPLGGKDGGKDALVTTNEDLKLIVAVYFPRGQQSFKEIKKKFNSDLKGAEKNNSDGVLFFTNQELRLSERTKLIKESEQIIEIYHLEKIATLLDIPQNYGLRLEFLEIEMTNEEVLAFYKQRDSEYFSQMKSLISELREAKEQLVKYTTGGDSYPVVSLFQPEDQNKIELLVEAKGDFPIYDAKIKIDYQKNYNTFEEYKENLKEWTFEPGTLVSNYIRIIGYIDYPDNFPATIRIKTYARNGSFFQELVLNLDQDGKIRKESYTITDDIKKMNIIEQFKR